MGLHQTKKLRTAKEVIKMKREPTEWENIFTNDTSDKSLISKMYLKNYRTQHQEDNQISKNVQRS